MEWRPENMVPALTKRMQRQPCLWPEIFAAAARGETCVQVKPEDYENLSVFCKRELDSAGFIVDDLSDSTFIDWPRE